MSNAQRSTQSHRASNQQFDLRIANVKGFTSVLNAIKFSSKQVCLVTVENDGLSFRYEEDSKSMQGSVFLKSELFQHYTCSVDPPIFGIYLPTLVDALGVFCSGQDGILTMKYPGLDGKLILEMRDHDAGVCVCTYSSISTLEEPDASDLSDHFTDPGSYFLLPGHLMKEVLEDLEWAGGFVELFMQRDPKKLVLTSTGQGTLDIQIGNEDLTVFRMAQDQLCYSYKYKFLRCAFNNLPSKEQGSNVTTKVSIDASGILKVTHMVALQDGPGQQGEPNMSAMVSSQMNDGSKVALVQFVILPAAEELD